MNPTSVVLTAAMAMVSAAPATGAVTASPSSACAWRITAVHVLAELADDTSARADRLRRALLDVGADRADFVPDRCETAGSGDQTGVSPGRNNDDEIDPGSGNTGIGDSANPDENESSPGGSGTNPGSSGQGATAADAMGWGQPDKVDDFDQGLDGWNIYDGPGHAGNGTRSPDAASVSDDVLTINGTGDGTTAGMAWGDGQKYGRWEGRMRAPKGSPSYNALFLLWPSEENFPVGGEIDFAEITDQSRDKVNLFLHYGADNSQVQGDVAVDATQWNNWAVEWTPKGVTAYLNGKKWWSTSDTSVLPPGPMHLCIQLDWFPKGDSETGQMQVDWVKQWSLDGAPDAAAGEDTGDTANGGSGAGGPTGARASAPG